MGCVRASYYEIVDIINDGLLDGADASDDEGYMEAVGAAFDAHGVSMSYPQMNVHVLDTPESAKKD